MSFLTNLFGGGSKPAPIPQAPAAPPPPPPLPNAPIIEESRKAALEVAAKAKGRRSTILTGGEGVLPGSISRKAVLGG